VKVGAENQKKTWIAVGLFVVALIMTIRMIGTSFSSSGSSTPTVSPAPQAATNRPVRRGVRRGKGPAPKQATAGQPVTPSLDPRLHLDALKETESIEYAGNGRNIFTPQATDIIEKPIAPGITNPKNPGPVVAQGPPPPPPPPPIPLKFFGFASQQGSSKNIFLSSGDDIFMAKEGDIVQRRYKIVKVNPTSIEVQDVLSNNRQTIPLTQG